MYHHNRFMQVKVSNLKGLTPDFVRGMLEARLGMNSLDLKGIQDGIRGEGAVATMAHPDAVRAFFGDDEGFEVKLEDKDGGIRYVYWERESHEKESKVGEWKGSRTGANSRGGGNGGKGGKGEGKMKEVECFKCGKWGHFANMCT